MLQGKFIPLNSKSVPKLPSWETRGEKANQTKSKQKGDKKEYSRNQWNKNIRIKLVKRKVLWEGQQSWQTFRYRLTKKKKIQITKISSERGDITSILTELKSVLEEYYDQLNVINLETKMKWVMNFYTDTNY